MPDTNQPYVLWDTSQPKAAFARKEVTGFRRRHILDQWDEAADEFRAIETAALDYLRALDNRRLSSYGADAVKRIDNHASDFAGRALDLLSDMHGEAQKAADEKGIDPDSLTYDDGLLRAEFETWTQRAEARR